MAKLQRHKNKVRGKDYSKWVTVISEDVIKKSKLKEGDELEVTSTGKGKIFLKLKKKT